VRVVTGQIDKAKAGWIALGGDNRIHRKAPRRERQALLTGPIEQGE
jgi:hypothetical protein